MSNETATFTYEIADTKTGRIFRFDFEPGKEATYFLFSSKKSERARKFELATLVPHNDFMVFSHICDRLAAEDGSMNLNEAHRIMTEVNSVRLQAKRSDAPWGN